MKSEILAAGMLFFSQSASPCMQRRTEYQQSDEAGRAPHLADSLLHLGPGLGNPRASALKWGLGTPEAFSLLDPSVTGLPEREWQPVLFYFTLRRYYVNTRKRTVESVGLRGEG